MQKILVATDGSQTALKAVKTAAEMAKYLPGASVTLITVGKPKYYFAEGTMGATDVVGDMVMLSEAQAEKIVSDSAATISEYGISLNSVTAIGDPRIEICSAAKKGGYDLVIIGNRGRNTLAELVLGSVSTHVVHCSECPVMVVK